VRAVSLLAAGVPTIALAIAACACGASDEQAPGPAGHGGTGTGGADGAAGAGGAAGAAAGSAGGAAGSDGGWQNPDAPDPDAGADAGLDAPGESGCAWPFADCDAPPDGICETNLTSSVQHCGACGTSCSYANATGACTSTGCALMECSAGWRNCDGDVANGCETDATTTSNCRACGVVCSYPNAAATCTPAGCAPGACHPGFGDCDAGQPGCETDLTSTLAHCGACESACSLPQATAQCVPSGTTGVCSFVSCDPGWDDCDGNLANGCESNTGGCGCAGCGGW
jgi:hypothetical protein